MRSEWEIEQAIKVGTKVRALEKQLSVYKKDKDYTSLFSARRFRIYAALLLTLGVVIIVVLGLGNPIDQFRGIPWYIILGVSGAFVITIIILIESSLRIRKYKDQIRQADDELDLKEVAEGDNKIRSEKLFRNHQRELKRYYDINLGHYRWMFPAGIMTILFGTGIVGATIWVFRNSSIAPLLIGAVSGVLVDFIGAVLIHMYTETVKSSIAFHSQLMKSNHALFANMLAFKIGDTTKHDETFAELAKLMIQSNVEQKK